MANGLNVISTVDGIGESIAVRRQRFTPVYVVSLVFQFRIYAVKIKQLTLCHSDSRVRQPRRQTHFRFYSIVGLEIYRKRFLR